MAISFKNVITRYYSGKVGDIVLRNYGGKSVMAKRPDCSKVVKTAKQVEINTRFAKAVKYGQYVIKNPQLSAYYKKKRPDLSPYNAAISDFMSRPVIERVDVSGYQGLPGNVVTVSVWDKWSIEGVSMVIINVLGEVVECGAAVPRQFSGDMEWDYIATKENLNYQGCKVIVSVSDKPGNVVQSTIVFNGSS
ncbi:MAG: hypothetical protein ABSD71_11130 [Bacteroidales bacterium]|jgi:hypothetical protein